MAFRTTRINGIIRIKADKALTIYSIRELHRIMKYVLDKNYSAEIDLSQVTSADTCGIQLLVAFKHEMIRKGLTLSLTGHPAEIVRILDLYGLIGFFGDTIHITRSLKSELSLSYGLARQDLT